VACAELRLEQHALTLDELLDRVHVQAAALVDEVELTLLASKVPAIGTPVSYLVCTVSQATRQRGS